MVRPRKELAAVAALKQENKTSIYHKPNKGEKKILECSRISLYSNSSKIAIIVNLHKIRPSLLPKPPILIRKR